MAKSRKIPAKFDHVNKQIILYKWFAEKAQYTKNKEYKTLIGFTADFPTYEVVIREDIDVNENQEHYKGLTYEYMKWYIGKYEPEETRDEVLAELDNKIDISKCHSKGRRYPAIKKWFLEKYPDVAKFGIPESDKDTDQKTEKQNEKINITTEKADFPDAA